jgi:hypothetical protein
MDATMGAMRSASERQLLARDCLHGDANARDRSRGTDEPSMECLMTLLWATYAIDRERQRLEPALQAEEVDATTAVRQASEELDEMFRTRNTSRPKREGVSFVDEGHVGRGVGPCRAQKSFEDYWRLAFKHG